MFFLPSLYISFTVHANSFLFSGCLEFSTCRKEEMVTQEEVGYFLPFKIRERQRETEIIISLGCVSTLNQSW